MRDTVKILTYVAVVVVGGALLAPPLYWAGQWAIDVGWLPVLERYRFATYLNRAVLLTALLALWPWLRWLGVRGWRGLGLENNSRRWRDVATGSAVAIGGFAVIAALLVLTKHVRWRGWHWDRAVAALVTGVCVAVIEEWLFRGVLLGVLRRHLSWQRALAIITFVFAAVHFVRPHRAAGKLVRHVVWSSGFDLMPYAFWQFTRPALFIGGFLTLLLVGWILGYTVVRTRSLSMAIGLHAGWVFALRAFDGMSSRRGRISIWFGRDLSSGLLAVVLLLATLGLVAWLLHHRRPNHSPATDSDAAITSAPHAA